MGCNMAKKHTPCFLINGLPVESRYYFVHSYYVKVDKEENSTFRTIHGLEFDSGIHADNIYSTQFHPEKSHKSGMALLKNFSEV